MWRCAVLKDRGGGLSPFSGGLGEGNTSSHSEQSSLALSADGPGSQGPGRVGRRRFCSTGRPSGGPCGVVGSGSGRIRFGAHVLVWPTSTPVSLRTSRTDPAPRVPRRRTPGSCGVREGCISAPPARTVSSQSWQRVGAGRLWVYASYPARKVAASSGGGCRDHGCHSRAGPRVESWWSRGPSPQREVPVRAPEPLVGEAEGERGFVIAHRISGERGPNPPRTNARVPLPQIASPAPSRRTRSGAAGEKTCGEGVPVGGGSSEQGVGTLPF